MGARLLIYVFGASFRGRDNSACYEVDQLMPANGYAALRQQPTTYNG